MGPTSHGITFIEEHLKNYIRKIPSINENIAIWEVAISGTDREATEKRKTKRRCGWDRGGCLLAGINIITDFFSTVGCPGFWKIGIYHHNFPFYSFVFSELSSNTIHQICQRKLAKTYWLA